MNIKTFPLSLEKVKEISKIYPTPFVIYDKKAIIENAKKFYEAFSWCSGFKNYFAVKATPNPTIIKFLKEIGLGADCSSFGELILSEKLGIIGENIMFTSNDTKAEEFIKAQELGAIINFDDITHIDFYKNVVGKMPEIACCRYNPGVLKEGNEIIGKPEEAKYGMTRTQIFEAYKKLKDLGIKRFGLHTMVASNEINTEYFAETAKILFELLIDIEKEVGISFEFVNLGGGIGIPYKPEQDKVDFIILSKLIKAHYDEIIVQNKKEPLKIVMECGRMITGPYGYLVSKVLHITSKYKKYVGLDASMQCLMRPALYGAYHHITVLGKESTATTETYDITGSLCENNDKFAVNRDLPKIDVGDILIIHDAGAHGTAMGFNYNAKLRPAELLLKENGSVELIRKAETLKNYFETVIGINGFNY